MTLTVFCPKCLRRANYAVSDLPGAHVCPCGESTAIDPAVKNKGMIDVCAVCGLSYLYVDTNFNKRLGLAIMAAAAVAYLALVDHWWALFILVGVAGLDALAYFWVPTYSICYKCLTEYRGFQKNPAHTGFELRTAQHFADGAGPSPDEKKH